jgi:hypothetical protein
MLYRVSVVVLCVVTSIKLAVACRGSGIMSGLQFQTSSVLKEEAKDFIPNVSKYTASGAAVA